MDAYVIRLVTIFSFSGNKDQDKLIEDYLQGLIYAQYILLFQPTKITQVFLHLLKIHSPGGLLL